MTHTSTQNEPDLLKLNEDLTDIPEASGWGLPELKAEVSNLLLFLTVLIMHCSICYKP